MADELDRISPLLKVADPGRFGRADGDPRIDLTDRLCTALVQVQAWPETIADTKAAIRSVTGVSVKAGSKAARKGGISVLPTGPGRWLIEGGDAGLEAELRKAMDADVAAVTGLTHARVVVTISGEKSEWVLASGVALDFAQAGFPVGEVRVSHHHEIGVTIHRTAADVFDLYVFTSYARGFWHWITRAAAEVGYTVS